MRPTVAEVDLAAIRDNVGILARLIAPSRVWAVVKAGAYGHGGPPAARAALAGGAMGLGVSYVEEGVELRQAGVEAPILLLTDALDDEVESVARWRLTASATSRRSLAALAQAPSRTVVDVQLVVDTGMHGPGFDAKALHGAVEMVRGLDSLRLAGIWTQAAVVGDASFAGHQIRTFRTLTAEFDVPKHMASTASGLLYPESRCDLVRVGLGVYGLHPSPQTRPLVDLKPALRLVSRVAYVRRYPSGTRLSYGRRRPLPVESSVATVPIGYGDGVPRALFQGGGQVLIGGIRHCLAGAVTMDQIIVDVGNSAVNVGDEVVLIGCQGSEAISADEWAARVGSISYEVISRIGPRVPRTYSDSEG